MADKFKVVYTDGGCEYSIFTADYKKAKEIAAKTGAETIIGFDTVFHRCANCGGWITAYSLEKHNGLCLSCYIKTIYGSKG